MPINRLRQTRQTGSYVTPALPENLIEIGVNIIIDKVPEAVLKMVREEIIKFPIDGEWIHKHGQHHLWGMHVRNLLRTNGLTDNLVGTGNLDDYYIELVEEAIERVFGPYPVEVK